MIGYRINQFLRSMFASFWFWPLTFIVAAISLSTYLSVALRGGQVADATVLGGLAAGADEYAGLILTTTAAADVTILTFVFSTLMVVLQLASSQLSPRILRTTLREGRAQLSMAIMAGGFVFSLYSLLGLYGGDEPVVAAALVLVAMGWTIAVILTFLYFVSYTVARIRAPAVIRSIGEQAARDIKRNYDRTSAPKGATVPDGKHVVEIDGPRDGLATGLDVKSLAEWARRRDALVELDLGLGDHVSAKVPIGRIASSAPLVRPQSMLRFLVVEPERTLVGDPPYGFRLLVDIANRALSPAINDPTTAVQVIDELESLLVLLAERPEQPGRIYDKDGVLRINLRAMDWSAHLRLAVQEIYESGRHSSQVTQRLARMLSDLDGEVTGERAASVRHLLSVIEVIPPMIPVNAEEGRRFTSVTRPSDPVA